MESPLPLNVLLTHEMSGSLRSLRSISLHSVSSFSSLPGASSCAHNSNNDRALIRSSSHSAVGGFMRRSWRFLRRDTSVAPIITKPNSPPDEPTRKDSAPAAYDAFASAGSLRHTQSFDGDALLPLWSPMDEDIEEEPGSISRPRSQMQRSPHRRTLGASHYRPSPAKERLKIRYG